jgi:hypothetical protein
MGKTAHSCSVNRTTLFLEKSLRKESALLAAFLVGNLTLLWGQNASTRPEAQPVASLADSLKRVDNTQRHIFYVHGWQPTVQVTLILQTSGKAFASF